MSIEPNIPHLPRTYGILVLLFHILSYCMPSSFFPSSPVPPPPIPTTRTNPLVWIVFGIIGVVLTAFMLTVAYYLWQLHYGDKEALAKKFESSITEEFSKVSGIGNTTVSEQAVHDAIRSHNPTLGPDTAPITIIAFIDFECPFCQKSYPIFTNILQQYDGAIRVVFKHLPLASIHPNAVDAAVAAGCAAEQDAFWDYYHLFFQSPIFSAEGYTTYAAQLSLDKKTFSSCIEYARPLEAIQEDIQDGIQLGVRGTPTYFVGTKKIEGVISETLWNSIILDAFKEAP